MIIKNGDTLYEYIWEVCPGFFPITWEMKEWFEDEGIPVKVFHEGNGNSEGERLIELDENDYIFLAMKYL